MSEANRDSIILKKNNFFEKINHGIEVINKSTRQDNYKNIAREILSYVKSTANSIIEENLLFLHVYYKLGITVEKLKNIFEKDALHINDFNDTIDELFSYTSNLQNYKYHNLLNEIITCRDDAKQASEETIKSLQNSQDFLNRQAQNVLKGGFNQVSEEEKKSANFFRNSAIWVFIIGVLISAGILVTGILFPKFIFNYSVVAIIYKVSFVGLLLVLGFFLAKESTFHRRAQHFNKQMALDMETIDPFLEGMNQEQKAEIRKQLAIKLFGMANLINVPDKSSNANINLILAKLLEKS